MALIRNTAFGLTAMEYHPNCLRQVTSLMRQRSGCVLKILCGWTAVETAKLSRCHQFKEMIGCNAPTTALPIRGPPPMRTIPAWMPAVVSHHAGAGPGLIDEHQRRRVHIALP
jgi:hypothetical protein